MAVRIKNCPPMLPEGEHKVFVRRVASKKRPGRWDLIAELVDPPRKWPPFHLKMERAQLDTKFRKVVGSKEDTKVLFICRTFHADEFVQFAEALGLKVEV